MPNYCENDVYVSGSKDDVDAFLAFVGANESPPRFSFDAILPYPESFRVRDDDAQAWRDEHGWPKARKMLAAKYGSDSDGYNAGGYAWCREHWGTKWGALDVVRRDYGDACVTFRTAWGPPIPVIAALHRQFPHVTISLEYFERGMAFCGGVTFESPDDWDGDAPREPGTPSDVWESRDYRGRRGG